jgi:hypothetical protein
MTVGFTITDLKGAKQAAIDYIKETCILESRVIAENLVNSGKLPINVYAPYVRLAPLGSLPFDFEYIQPQPGKYVVASIVNFMVELPFNAGSIRLLPTQYVHVAQKEIEQLLPYVRQGLIRTFPEYDENGVKWILETGYWDDEGKWIDMAEWDD